MFIVDHDLLHTQKTLDENIIHLLEHRLHLQHSFTRQQTYSLSLSRSTYDLLAMLGQKELSKTTHRPFVTWTEREWVGEDVAERERSPHPCRDHSWELSSGPRC